jgi:hypothetical protein
MVNRYGCGGRWGDPKNANTACARGTFLMSREAHNDTRLDKLN